LYLQTSPHSVDRMCQFNNASVDRRLVNAGISDEDGAITQTRVTEGFGRSFLQHADHAIPGQRRFSGPMVLFTPLRRCEPAGGQRSSARSSGVRRGLHRPYEHSQQLEGATLFTCIDSMPPESQDQRLRCRDLVEFATQGLADIGIPCDHHASRRCGSA
jgi:hypothetical protein